MHHQAPVVRNSTTTFPPSLSARAKRIRSHLTTATVEIGFELIEARNECPPGKWLVWLRQEFNWSEETARKLMRVAEAFQLDGNAGGIKELPIDVSALYELSKPEVSQKVRQEAVTLAKSGERVTKRVAQPLVKRRKLTSQDKQIDKSWKEACDRAFGKEEQETAPTSPPRREGVFSRPASELDRKLKNVRAVLSKFHVLFSSQAISKEWGEELKQALSDLDDVIEVGCLLPAERAADSSSVWTDPRQADLVEWLEEQTATEPKEAAEVVQ
jgi:hypothetical protein